MAYDVERRWLAELSERGDRLVTELYGHDRLSTTWSVSFPHGLPEHLVYLLVAGTVRGAVADSQVELRAGTLLWLPPRTPFRLHAIGSRTPRLYRFRLMPTPTQADAVRLIDEAWTLRESIDALVSELDGRLAFRAERIRGLLVVLFTGILRLSSAPTGLAPLPESTRARVEEYAERRVAERATVADLAGVAGLSTDYFTRRFRATYGIAPRPWLVRRRVHHAMLRLEESGDTISAIAHGLGYPDLYLFSRQFTSVTGVSPRSWRRGRRPMTE